MNDNLREWLGLKPHYVWAYAGAGLLAAGCLVDSPVPAALFLIGATLTLLLFLFRSLAHFRSAEKMARSTRIAGRVATCLWAVCHFALVAGKLYMMAQGESVTGWIMRLVTRE